MRLERIMTYVYMTVLGTAFACYGAVAVGYALRGW